MLETRHHWLPIIIAIYMPVSFIITYSIAVGNDHVEPGFPYISDTGTRSPESCVFGQLLNIGAGLASIIIYIRYRHCLHHFDNTGRRNLLHLNTAAFIIGLLTVFGVSLVGNFQETNVIIVHLLGAFLAFGIGFVYMILQTVISYKSTPCSLPGNTLCIRRFRSVLCVVDFVLLLVLSIMTAVAQQKGPGKDSSGKEIAVYDWTSAYPGYAEHLVATISEWLVAFVTVIYFSTFYTEFKHFRMKPAEVAYYKDEQRTEIATNIYIRTESHVGNYTSLVTNYHRNLCARVFHNHILNSSGNDHVAPGFPYISYTGSLSPESCVFSQLLNIAAVLGGIIIFIRFRQCLLVFQKRNELCHLNTATFIVGMFAVFGISIVGNFQATNVIFVHLAGAFLAFVVGFVYMILQTIISYMSTQCDSTQCEGNSPCIRIFRLVLCVVDFILLITFFTAREISKTKGPGPGTSLQHWGRDDPGYAEHIIAAVSEWLVAFVTVIYFATFYTESKHFRMELNTKMDKTN